MLRQSVALVALCVGATFASAFEAMAPLKVVPLLATTKTWEGAPIVYPQGQLEISGLIIELAPGAETGWHSHPVPSFAFILEGTLEVQLKDGRSKRLQAGDALAEVVGTLHNGKAIGDIPVKLVVFYAGAVGQNLTVPVASSP